MNNKDILKPEDYMEPRCVLCDDPYGKAPEVKPVPQARIIEKLDEYMEHADYEGARRHLLYWLEEAQLGHDLRGELVIRNELIGHYRKTAYEEGAFSNISRAVELLDELEFEGTISAGTTYTNAATALHAFGKYEQALEMFEKALKIYEDKPGGKVKPELMGGLYNNMALACVAAKQYDRAHLLYKKALEQMSTVPSGELEQAITYLNMADALQSELGIEESQEQTDRLLEKAYELLDKSSAPRDGYYAFVCEKCAPVFSYYGYFIQAQELENRSKEIYQRDKK